MQQWKESDDSQRGPNQQKRSLECPGGHKEMSPLEKPTTMVQHSVPGVRVIITQLLTCKCQFFYASSFISEALFLSFILFVFIFFILYVIIWAMLPEIRAMMTTTMKSGKYEIRHAIQSQNSRRYSELQNGITSTTL